MEKITTSPDKPVFFTKKELRELKESLNDMHFEEAKRITEVLIGKKGIEQVREALTKLGYQNLGAKGYTPELRSVFQEWQMSQYGKSHPAILDIGYTGRKAAYGVIGVNGLSLLLSQNKEKNIAQETKKAELVSKNVENNTPQYISRTDNKQRYESVVDGKKYTSNTEYIYHPSVQEKQLFKSYFPAYQGESFTVRSFKPQLFQKMDSTPMGFYNNENALWIRADHFGNNSQELSPTLRNEAWHCLFDRFQKDKQIDKSLKNVHQIRLPFLGKVYTYNPYDEHFELNQFGSDVMSVMGQSYEQFTRDMDTNVGAHNDAAQLGERSEYSLSAHLMYSAYRQAENKYGENGDPGKKITYVRQILQGYLSGLLNGGNKSLQYIKKRA